MQREDDRDEIPEISQENEDGRESGAGRGGFSLV